MLREDRRNQALYTRNNNRSNIIFGQQSSKTIENQKYQRSQTLNNNTNVQIQNKYQNPGQKSIIGNMMDQTCYFNHQNNNNQNINTKSAELKTYKNKIIPFAKDYSVPKIQSFGDPPERQKFQDVLQRRKKFSKPYAQCTRYLDSLMKNKALIRRGPYQVPLQSVVMKRINKNQNSNIDTIFNQINTIDYPNNPSNQKNFHQNNNRIKYNKTYNGHSSVSQIQQRSRNNATASGNNLLLNSKKQTQDPNNKNKAKHTWLKTQNKFNKNPTNKLSGNYMAMTSSDFHKTQHNLQNTHKGIHNFNNTLKDHLQSYKSLIQKQRSHKEQSVDLKNSMNRMLAAEMITYSLLSKEHKLRPRKKFSYQSNQYSQSSASTYKKFVAQDFD